ncbi:OmpA family protein [Nocardiopsis composta]|uniref:Outer membrane protein OmpA-like peptidoglycan-associated protein n=1 Tax=Nocardiopsis composta TaxID=157465 RepID=A0A7W8VGR8_9ACTN|nr:OmpA family protein [Nocardiopsis composta]MBB5435911.1 outer membrane protein OmpA-like peptidoglycan-associated protein [Nocardiopsis composta]
MSAPAFPLPRTAVLAASVAALLLVPVPAAADPAATAGDPESPSADSLAASVTSIDPDAAVTGIDPAGSVEELEQEEITGSSTTVTISADVLFAFDEAELTDAAQSTVAELAGRLEGVSGTVQVVGHSDGIGEESYNQDLSERRAEAVKEAIEEELGSGAPEIEAEGRGSDEPIAEETDSEGADIPSARAQNRRVEITFEGG